MAVMIPAFGSQCGDRKHWNIPEASEHLCEAHAALALAGKLTLQKAAGACPDGDWGASVKREPVRCGQELHNLAEVVNQCATVERLIDALTWAASEFPEWLVECCHPTQTSGEGQNDLVLIDPTNPGQRARFEVSDVVSTSDGNNKEAKDLTSLKVLSKRPEAAPKIETLNIANWPSDRLFLVVSGEFANYLQSSPTPGRIWMTAHCWYDEAARIPHDDSRTVILEVKNRKI